MEKLIQFLDIDSDTMRRAQAIWPMIEPRTSYLIEELYVSARQFDCELALSDDTIDDLKTRQTAHWRTLFESRFDRDYINSASLIGIQHRELGIDAQWYIAGYNKVKSDLAQTILNAPLLLASKATLLATLDKYIALDMTLVVSSYTSWLVD